jgi:hypothetical protein
MFRWQLRGACPLPRAGAHISIERAIQVAWNSQLKERENFYEDHSHSERDRRNGISCGLGYQESDITYGGSRILLLWEQTQIKSLC